MTERSPEMRERILFVSDMDGTLLDNDARLSRDTVTMLNRLTEAGGLFTVATARTPATVEPLLAGVASTLPAIVMTGAALWHRDTQTYSNIHHIPGGVTAQIQRHFAAAGVAPFDYVLRPDGELTVYHAGAMMTDAERLFYDQRRDLPLKHFELDREVPGSAREHHVLFFGMGDSAKIHRAASLLRPLGCAMSVYSDTYTPGLALIEVFAPGVSKAAAVRELKAIAGVDRLVVYGDNLNDLPMMSVADLSVAVANAVPEVRKTADVTIGANTDSSVAAHALEMYSSGCNARR